MHYSFETKCVTNRNSCSFNYLSLLDYGYANIDVRYLLKVQKGAKCIYINFSVISWFDNTGNFNFARSKETFFTVNQENLYYLVLSNLCIN